MKPDWGHGPNPPVLMYTAEQIRAVLTQHHPTGPDQGEVAGLCSCRYQRKHAEQWSIDHVLDNLGAPDAH